MFSLFVRAIACAVVLSFLSFARNPVAAQIVRVEAPQARPATTLRNDTGKRLRLHLFYGHDTAQIFAFHEVTVEKNETINLDRFAGVTGNQRGGQYVINVFQKGGGFLGFDVHWRKDLKVYGTSVISGTGGNVRVTPGDRPRKTIRLRNETGQDITAKIFNAGDTTRSIPAFTFKVPAGETVHRQFQSRTSYGLSLFSHRKREIFADVVAGQSMVVIARPPARTLKVASLNSKLMVAVFAEHAAMDLDVDGRKTPYEDRISGITKLVNLGWQDGETRQQGFDVLGLQEIWRHTMVGDYHFVQLHNALERLGFASENILRGTNKGFERGWHHGLVIASRYPIISRDELKFNAASFGSEDPLAEKGALFARIDINGTTVAVFNTHLQAPGGLDPVGARDSQLSQLRRFISSSAEPGEPIIVMGDFNIDRKTCPADQDKEYCHWLTGETGGNWSGYVDHRPLEQRYGVDYILSASPNDARVEGQTYENWVHVDEFGTPSLYAANDASTADQQKITDHPLIYGAFEVSH